METDWSQTRPDLWAEPEFWDTAAYRRQLHPTVSPSILQEDEEPQIIGQTPSQLRVAIVLFHGLGNPEPRGHRRVRGVLPRDLGAEGGISVTRAGKLRKTLRHLLRREDVARTE